MPPHALISRLQSVETFRLPSSGRSVGQTRRLGIRLALPTVEGQGAHPRRSRHARPLRSVSNAESVPEHWFWRALRVRPFAAWGWRRRSPRVRGWSHQPAPSPRSVRCRPPIGPPPAGAASRNRRRRGGGFLVSRVSRLCSSSRLAVHGDCGRRWGQAQALMDRGQVTASRLAPHFQQALNWPSSVSPHLGQVQASRASNEGCRQASHSSTALR